MPSAGPGYAGGVGVGGESRGLLSRHTLAASGVAARAETRDGVVPSPPPRGVPDALGSVPRDASSDARSAHSGVHRALADASLGRSRESGGWRAPPLPPGAPPGAPRRPGHPAAPAPAEERDVERDLFQAELERVVAEQEAERRRRESPGAPGVADADGTARTTGAPFAPPGPGGGADATRGGGLPRANARELAGSALVSHPPVPPGVPPIAHGAPRGLGISRPGAHGDSREARAARLPAYERPVAASGAEGDGVADDVETRGERKKRGGRRVREAEERRAAKASENATASSALRGGDGSFYPDTGLGLGRGAGGAPPGPAAARGWGAGALGGLAWAGPVAEIQRSASSDALAHTARARLASDQGGPGRADAAATAAAHHHAAAAASNAFARDSAIAALGGSVGLGFGGGLWSTGGPPAPSGAPPLPPGPPPSAHAGAGAQGSAAFSAGGSAATLVAAAALEDD